MPSFKCWRKQGFKTNLFECVSALLTLIADAFIILLLYLLGLVRVRILFLYLLGRLHIDYMEHIIVQKLYRLPYLHFFNGFSFLFIKKKNGSIVSDYHTVHLQFVNRKNHGYGLPADIWSLGCTVLEMLTREIPYSNCECVRVMFFFFYFLLRDVLLL